MKRFACICLALALSLLMACDPDETISFQVTTTADTPDPIPGDDICGTASACSLRAALEEAALGDKKLITIRVPSGTILLENGVLELSGKVITLKGEDPDESVIDAQNDSRVMRITGGIVSMENITLQKGRTSSNRGGGLLIEGENTVVVLDSVIIQESASLFQGGGLYIDDATVSIKESSIKNNRTGLGGGGGGGGILNRGDLVIRDSTISGNKGGYSGGGIGHFGQRLVISSSTINANLSPRSGLVLQGSSQLSNVTVSGNRDLDEGSFRDEDGVGVSIFGSATFRNVTVTDNGNTNISRNDDSGGVYVGSGGSLTLQNSLLAGNFGGDCKGMLSSDGFNLIGNAELCTLSAASGDQVGTAAAPIDAKLADLANNGGLTETHALQDSSPAIDAGSNLAPVSDPSACLPKDQRGVERPQDGDGALPNICDIGAFELRLESSRSAP